MATGYDYRCNQCGDEWLLFSSWFTLGPTQWGSTEFTCFVCQTFLEVADTVDAKCWGVWRSENDRVIGEHAEIAGLVEQVEERLAAGRPLTPVTLDFLSPNCPICLAKMSTVPFGQHLMKCRRCNSYTGEYASDGVISSYGVDVNAYKADFLRGFNAP